MPTMTDTGQAPKTAVPTISTEASTMNAAREPIGEPATRDDPVSPNTNILGAHIKQAKDADCPNAEGSSEAEGTPNTEEVNMHKIFPLLKLPAELMKMIFDVFMLQKDGLKHVVRCAMACQQLWKLAEPYLWITVPGLELAHYDTASEVTELSTLTGTAKDEHHGTAARAGWMACTQALSLSFDVSEYLHYPDRINANFQMLGSQYPTHSRNVKFLTVTPHTVFHKPVHFDHYVSIIEKNRASTLVYVPELHPHTGSSIEDAARCSTVAAWIQQSAFDSSGAPLDGPDLFLESGADPVNLGRLLKNPGSYYGASFFGTKETHNGSIAKLCNGIGLLNTAPVTVLRFYNIGTITYNGRFQLNALKKLEILDCTDPQFLLKGFALASFLIEHLMLADSGYEKKTPTSTGKKRAASVLKGAHLLNAIHGKNKLRHLCVYMGEVTDLTAAEIISALPTTLERLVLAHAETDILKPQDYQKLALQCPLLEGLGTTLSFAKEINRTMLEARYKEDLDTMIKDMNMPGFQRLTIFRFSKAREYKPKDLASHLFDNARRCGSTLKTVSVVRKETRYTASRHPAGGDHFQLENNGRVVKMVRKDMDGETVTNLRFESAMFARDMKNYAKSEGIRYQFDGTDDKDTKLGWSEENYKDVSV